MYSKRDTIVGKIAGEFAKQQTGIMQELVVNSGLLLSEDSVQVIDEKKESKVSVFLAIKEAQISKSKIARLSMKDQI